MLSIVKMDFDSDIEILDDNLIKMEEVDKEDTLIDDNDDFNILSNCLHNLELVPIVYTTKLDDMGVLRLDPSGMDPNKVSDRILRESRPVLDSYPGPPRRSRRNPKKFGKVKTFLQQIYRTKHVIREEETGSNGDGNKNELDLNLVKTEVIDEPIVEETNEIRIQSVKSEVLDEQLSAETKTENTCRYSDLLKLCKPCSVVLTEPVRIGPYVCSRVIHGGQVLKANKVQKSTLGSSPKSVSDDNFLTTHFKPNILVKRKHMNFTEQKINFQQSKTPEPCIKLVKTQQQIKTPEPCIKLVKKLVKKAPLVHPPGTPVVNNFRQRPMRNGVLEIFDTYSNVYHVYYTDNECNLVEYCKDTGDNAYKYQSLNLHASSRVRVQFCCWISKDETIQTWHPKVCMYSSSRFIRGPHPCRPGACRCCCRKKENLNSPQLNQDFSEKLNNKKQTANEGMEIEDLEDKITKNIINTNKLSKHCPKERMVKLLNAIPTDGIPDSLIGKSLIYNKRPVAPTQVNNRRLVTLQKKSENTVLIFRNFGADVIEIYEINANNVESHLKTSCFTNTTQSDVKKLLKVPNAVNEVICCWVKREEVITKLQGAKIILPRAAKFIRTNHTCPSGQCACCCKPKKNKEIKLKNVMLPLRSLLWMSTLKAWNLTSEPEYTVVQEPPQLGQLVQTQSAPSVPAPSTSQQQDNDDDCQITSVMTSPTLQPPPAVPTPAVPPSIFIPKASEGDELSQEVNALITSILDRFKDVRLTINGEGKIAAALNTPVNTLSTVELKVLANILSYAQSQVNLLGSKVNSGMSLSHIINLKVDNIQSNTPIDPSSVYKEFSKNVDITFPLAPRVSQVPQSLPNLANARQTYSYFTNTMSLKNQQFNDAFSSFINTKMDPTPGTFTPVIENVYSLKDNETAEAAQTTDSPDEDSSFTTVWYRKPAAQTSVSTLSEESWQNTNKKQKDDSVSEAAKSIKIRVLPPNKLSATSTSEVPAATVQIPSQATVPVQGLRPGLIYLPNNNYNLSQTSTQAMVNCLPPVSSSQPILILNPLQNSGGVLSAQVGNNMFPNMPNLVPIQSRIPLIINSGGNNPTFVANPTSMGGLETENPEMENNTDVGTIGDNLEIANDPDVDNDTMDDCAYDDIDDVEMKFSPENKEDEDDCILGF